MSGMVNPRPYIRPLGEQKPDTMSNRLEKLGKNESGPVKIDKDGRITGGGLRMSLSSGLHFFGIGKPKEDIESNRQTLENVITLLRTEAKQMMIEQNKQWKEGDYEKHWHIDPDTFADKVIESLLKSTTYQDGDSKLFGKTDPGYTLRERYERGTYLSGDLARQIKQSFDKISRGTIDKTSGNMVDLDEKVAQQRSEARRRGINFEVYGGTNQDSVRRFLGQEVKNEGILPSLVNVGAGLVDGIKGAFDKLTGTETRDTAFERTLLQIREQGTKARPPSDTAFWDAFEEHWTRAMTAPLNSIEGGEYRFVQSKLEQFANKEAREGRIVDEKMIGEYLTRLLTNGPMMGRIGDLRNHNYVTNAKVEDIAKAIELWRDQQPLEVREQISQNDCEWLAREIMLSQEGERLLRERAPNVEMSIKDWGTDFFSFDKTFEKFGSSNVLSKIYETMGKNYGEMDQPYFMTAQQRQQHYFTDDKPLNEVDVDNAMRKRTDDKVLAQIRQTRSLVRLFNPPKWGPETLARLIGDSIKDVLIDRHKRIEQRMPELQENRESRELLQQNLEPFPLLKLQAQRYMDHPELEKHNPTKPSEFIRAIISDPIIYARTVAEMHRQIQAGLWKSTLPPEPQPPNQGAPRSEIEKYQQDKNRYEKLVGEEHGRFMKEAGRVREIERDILNSTIGKFEVLDELQQTIEELKNVDLKNLGQDKEAMDEFGRKIDELRQKAGQMWEYAFFMINDSQRKMEVTDTQARDILGAVMAGWCDIDAMLNNFELEAGRARFETRQLLDTPRLESSNQTLRESDTNLRYALEDTLKALEIGDRKKIGPASDELKRQLVSAFNTAFPLYTEGGTDSEQAGQLLELVNKAIRVAMEFDRTPELRDRKELGVEGWNELVNGSEDRLFTARIEQQLGKLPPPPDRHLEPLEKPSWMRDELYKLVLPLHGVQDYVSRLTVGNSNLSGSETIHSLFDITVLRQAKLQMGDEIQNDKSIKEQDKPGALRQRRTLLDQRWDEKIAPGLNLMEEYKTVPSLPEKLDRQSIEEHARELTKYIETMTKAYDALVVATTEAIALEQESQGERKTLFGNLQQVTGLSLGDIGTQIDLAKQRLQALN